MLLAASYFSLHGTQSHCISHDCSFGLALNFRRRMQVCSQLQAALRFPGPCPLCAAPQLWQYHEAPQSTCQEHLLLPTSRQTCAPWLLY